MGVSMIYQMRIMPTPSMDGAQKWLMKSMPIIFLVFCYNFPSALVLYWTVQNLLTILQQMILNKKDDDALFIDDLNPKKKKKLHLLHLFLLAIYKDLKNGKLLY